VLLFVILLAGSFYFLGGILFRQLPVPPLAALPWIFSMAVVCWIGNILQTISNHRAPNPGFTTAIIGVQSPFVALAAIFMFQDSLNWLKFAGMLVCLVGLMLLSWKESKGAKGERGWVIFGVIAMVLIGWNTLMYRQLGLMGVAPDWINFGMMFGACGMNFIHTAGTQKPLPWGEGYKVKTIWLWFALCILGSTLGSACQAIAFREAPNPGYPISLISCDGMLTSLFAWKFFGHALTRRQMGGVLLCLLGLIVVAWGK